MAIYIDGRAASGEQIAAFRIGGKRAVADRAEMEEYEQKRAARMAMVASRAASFKSFKEWRESFKADYIWARSAYAPLDFFDAITQHMAHRSRPPVDEPVADE